jgi:glycosyltransferase involved in cell wall biosynthesis
MQKLKILASHPVQYQVPFLKEIAASGIDIEVGFYHQGTAVASGLDQDFGIPIKWDIDLLSGYKYRFFVDGPASFRLKEQLRLMPRILKWALQDRKTPLLISGWFAHVVWLVWLLRILLRQPVMMFGETNARSFAAALKPQWRVRLLYWLLRHTGVCFYIGQRSREFLEAVGVRSDRLFPTPYSIDNARFHEMFEREISNRAAWCAHYGLDAHLPTLLFCGKLIPKKRPLELLRAYHTAGLQDKVQLIYVGEGQQRPELEHYIQAEKLDHVHLLGFFNQTQMPLAYVLGEVLCLLSDVTETWGLVVNEALACGRPVIVTDSVGCAPDLITSETGWIVPFDDHTALVEALRAVYDLRRSWETKGKQGQKRVAHHTFQIMAEGVQLALVSLRVEHA